MGATDRHLTDRSAGRVVFPRHCDVKIRERRVDHLIKALDPGDPLKARGQRYHIVVRRFTLAEGVVHALLVIGVFSAIVFLHGCALKLDNVLHGLLLFWFRPLHFDPFTQLP